MFRLLLLSLSLFLLSCGSVEESEEAWAAEEVLLQLEELRIQVVGLTKEVDLLKKRNE